MEYAVRRTTAFLRDVSSAVLLWSVGGWVHAAAGTGWQQPSSVGTLQVAALGGAAVAVSWRALRAFKARRTISDTALNLWLSGVVGGFVGALLAIGSAAL